MGNAEEDILHIASQRIDLTKLNKQIAKAKSEDTGDSTSPIDRKFPIFGPIDNDTSQSFIQSLLVWMSESITEPVEMWINSPGGSVSDALAIYDLIKYTPFPIHTIGIGEVCSAATLLLSSGEKGKRMAFPNCRIMLHSLSYGAQGTLQDMDVLFQEVRTLQSNWAKLTSDNTNMTEQQVLDMFDKNKDHYISTDEAIELGIIDKTFTSLGEVGFGN